MAKRLFNKEFFIRSVKYNVRTLFRKEIEEATEQQIFQAVGYAVKDAIMDAWIATQKEYDAITTSPTDLLNRNAKKIQKKGSR